jgi:hypothetical protein
LTVHACSGIAVGKLAYPPPKTKQNPRESGDALWSTGGVSFYEGFKASACRGGFCQTMCWIGGVFVKVILGFNGKAPLFGWMIVTLPFPGVVF